MSHHTDPNEHDKTKDEGAGPAEKQAGDHEVNPADGPGPRGNPETDEERVSRSREDLERGGAN